MVVETKERESPAIAGATLPEEDNTTDTLNPADSPPDDPSDEKIDSDLPEPPPFIRRLLAALLDIGIPLALVVTLNVWLTFFDAPQQASTLAWAAPLIISVAHMTIGYATKTTTIGKAIFSIQVLDLDLNEPSWNAALTRSIAWHFQLFLLGLPFVLILFSSDRMGFHCRISGTRAMDALYRVMR